MKWDTRTSGSSEQRVKETRNQVREGVLDKTFGGFALNLKHVHDIEDSLLYDLIPGSILNPLLSGSVLNNIYTIVISYILFIF